MKVLDRIAETAAPIHDLLARRWSPRAFDPRAIEPEKLRSLFEAARWAPSSYNAQPWYFIVATRDDKENFERVLKCLVEFNAAWARNAAVLVLSVARLNFEHDGTPNRHAFHDIGLAAENLVIQATALGLAVHQMAGILPDKAREVFAIPQGYEAVTGIAIGYPGDPDSLPEKLRERELAPRTRKPLDSFVFTGQWGQASRFAK